MTPWIRAALAVLPLVVGLPAQADVKYLFSTPAYTFVRNAATPCGGGTCTDLATTESVTGYFTTAAPLPAHLTTSDDVRPLITGWRFSNGPLSFGHDSPGARATIFRLATDQAGKPTHAEIWVQRWQDQRDGSPLHKIGDRVEVITARTSPYNPEFNYTLLNMVCGVWGNTGDGVTDACLGGYNESEPTASIAKYPAPGRLVMDAPLATINDASVNEGHTGTTDMVFTVSLDKTPAAGVSLDWATADGWQARAGEDYVAASGTLTWAAGDAMPKTITVKVKGDTAFESSETLKVLLNNLVGVGGGASTVGTGTILNDDAPAPFPTLSISSASGPEGNGGTTPMRFFVSLSSPPPSNVSVEWFTADDSATAPSDYQQASGTLNWSAGDASPRTITVLVKGDTAVEPDERFSVFLANASGAILPPGSREGVGTITNDDGGTMPPPGGGAHSVPALSDWGQLALSATLIGAAALHRRLAPRANRPAPRSHA